MASFPNTVVWADIPVTDLDRAIKFYSAVLQQELKPVEGMEGVALIAPPEGFDPSAMEGPPPVSFDLARNDSQTPSTSGCTIYLNSNDDPEGMLQRAADAGGKILMPVQYMGEMIGSIGFFLDPEGNRIGVHKPPPMP
jgi:predicted enzyme related to lactoylglutathione lyase